MSIFVSTLDLESGLSDQVTLEWSQMAQGRVSEETPTGDFELPQLQAFLHRDFELIGNPLSPGRNDGANPLHGGFLPDFFDIPCTKMGQVYQERQPGWSPQGLDGFVSVVAVLYSVLAEDEKWPFVNLESIPNMEAKKYNVTLPGDPGHVVLLRRQGLHDCAFVVPG